MPFLSPLERKLSSCKTFGPAEREALSTRLGRPRVVAARTELPLADENGPVAYLIADGWALTYKILPDGTRQVIEIAVPGDMIGVGALRVGSGDLMAATITTVTVRDLTAASFEALLGASVRAGMALLWSYARDESMLVEHLVDIGRRTATERVGHFMLELHGRLEQVGFARDGRFKCPLSQPLIADALGLTAIHLNRTLRDLRTRGLMIFRAGVVEILDMPRLARQSGFDGAYLHPAEPAATA
jgi:CRP-like cAMP-binding protein